MTRRVGDMYADAEVIAQAAAAIDGPVVVVAHSYGGVPTTQGLSYARNVRHNDVDTLTARRAVSQLGYQSYASMRQQLTETAWKTIPSTYVICEADNAIPVATQELIAGAPMTSSG